MAGLERLDQGQPRLAPPVRGPAAIGAAQDLKHGPGLEGHQDRGDHARQREVQDRGQDDRGRPPELPQPAAHRRLDHDQQFWHDQKADDPDRKADRLRRLIAGKDREELVRVGEIVGRRQVRPVEERGDQEPAPEDRGDIGHDPKAQRHAAPPRQTGGTDDAGMLKVALAPAPVALGMFDQVLRPFLI